MALGCCHHETTDSLGSHHSCTPLNALLGHSNNSTDFSAGVSLLVKGSVQISECQPKISVPGTFQEQVRQIFNWDDLLMDSPALSKELDKMIY